MTKENENQIPTPNTSHISIGKNSIETYSEDMVKVLESNEDGLIKKIIKEQEDKEEEHKNISSRSFKNKIYISLALFILLVSIVGLVFYFYQKRDISVTLAPRFVPIIFLDQSSFIDVSLSLKEEISATIFNKVTNSTVKEGGIEGVYLIENKKNLSFERLSQIMKFNLTKKDFSYLGSNYLFGIFKKSTLDKSLNENGSIDDIKTEDDPTIEVVVEGDPISLNISALFKTAKTEFLDENAKETAKKSLGDFLDGVDFSTSKIQVVGTYSIDRPWDKNELIAEERRKVGVDILMEVLGEKYTKEQIDKITIESMAKGMAINDIYSKEKLESLNPLEISNAIDSTQGIQYIIEAKTKSKVTTITAPIDQEAIDRKKEKERKLLEKNKNKNADLFVLLKVRSFADVFPIMNVWENKMFSDLHGFFGIELSPETNYLLTKSFEDGIVQNKNARVLYDKDMDIVMMYVYADDTSIIITNTENATREVILRLVSSQIKK